MIEDEDSGGQTLTAGCLGLEGSDFQCRVRIFSELDFVFQLSWLQSGMEIISSTFFIETFCYV